jgi:hypothetical protein
VEVWTRTRSFERFDVLLYAPVDVERENETALFANPVKNARIRTEDNDPATF